MYTANQPGLDTALTWLHAIYSEQIVLHIYKDSSAMHRIPSLATVEQQPYPQIAFTWLVSTPA